MRYSRDMRFIALITIAACLAGCASDASTLDPMEAYQRASEPDRRAIERVSYATRAIESGQLTDAELADALYWRGESYYYLRNYESARRDYTEVLRILPSDGMTYGARGHAALLMRRYDDAIADYRRALQLTGAAEWREALANAERDRDADRSSAPPPRAQRSQARQVELVYVGMHAEKIMRDSVVDPDNDAFTQSLDRLDSVSGDTLVQSVDSRLHGNRPFGAGGATCRNDCRAHNRQNPTSHRFHFGEFRHISWSVLIRGRSRCFG